MTVLTPVIDQALCPKLMVASQEGDQHAYCQLLMKVVPLVEAIAVHQGFNAASTDTLIADVLRTVHAMRHTYHPSQDLTRWLIGIVCLRMKQYQNHHPSNCGCTTRIESVSKVISSLDRGEIVKGIGTGATEPFNFASRSTAYRHPGKWLKLLKVRRVTFRKLIARLRQHR